MGKSINLAMADSFFAIFGMKRVEDSLMQVYEIRVLLDGEVKGYVHLSSFGYRWSNWKFYFTAENAPTAMSSDLVTQLKQDGYAVEAVKVEV